MSDAAELGSNIVVDAPASPAPPPPPIDVAGTPLYAMAPNEQFTRQQYNDAGWTDDQLLAAGKMSVINVHGTIELKAPIGMPDSTWILLEESDDIPPTGLFVGHNGTGFLIQTAVPVLVPNHVIAILDDAIMAAPVTNPQTKQVIGWRNRQRYAYRRVAAPADPS